MTGLFKRVTARRVRRALPAMAVVGALLGGLIAGPGAQKASATTMPAAATSPGFVTRQGTQLILGGSTFKFSGVAADAMFGCWAGEDVHSDAVLDQFFAGLAPQSVVRIFFMPGASITIMNQLVAAAARHGDFLAPSLAENAGNCDATGAKDSAWYAGGYQGAYWNWINQVVPLYANTPQIAFWELINEPGDYPGLKAMLDNSAALIKSLDHNHLVGTGTQPSWNYANYTSLASGPNIDLLSMHEYQGGSTMSGWEASTDAAAKAVNKPFYVGEFGYSSGANPAIPAQSWEQRAPQMVAKFNAYLAVPECAGAIYWDFKIQAQYAPNSAGDAMTFGDAGFAALATIKVPTPTVISGGGGTGPPTVYTAANDNTLGTTDGHFAYSTGWTYAQANDPAKYKGDDHYTNVAGSTVTLHFKGTSAQIYGAKAAWYGYATFSVDGATAKKIDLYAATRADQVMLFNTRTLPAGEHTVTIQVTGQHDTNATDSYMSIDSAGWSVK